MLPVHNGQSLLTVVGSGDRIAVALQNRLHQTAGILVIIHH